MTTKRPIPATSTRPDYASGRQPSYGNDDEGSTPRKRQRKQRPLFSCEECRRLKMKCDRQVPCSNCVRRQRANLCHGVTTTQIPSGRESDNERSGREQDVGQAQQLDSSIQNLERSSPAYQTYDHQLTERQQREHQPGTHGSSTSQPQAHVTAPASRSGNASGHDQMRHNNNQTQHDQLNFLTPPLGQYNVQNAPSYSPTSVPSGRTAEVSQSIPSEANIPIDPDLQPADEGEQSGSYGTLMLSEGGRSKYLGPTASSEWLKESETRDISNTPPFSRAPSPEEPQTSQPHRPTAGSAPIAFPFNASPARIRTRDLLSCLPPKDEAWTLVESYYRYCAWHHDVAPKTPFQKTFERVYMLADGLHPSPTVDPQEIALVFIIMAQGTMFNIEMPNFDSSAEEWLHLSERALVKADFLSKNTLAGVQTLHLMAHLNLHLEKGRRGDNAWPLWGLVMRLIQAMGMHRDGVRWNLPQDIVEERRKVFWECNAADVFQAHIFSRPCAINPEHCDTAFPSQPLNLKGEKSYYILRFELSQISSEILNMAMKVRKPAYIEVTNLDRKLCEFENNLPFSLRCRAAFLSMPSRYPKLEAAIEASPEPSKRSMTVSFQQTNLALNISETIINLHRPYFAKALYDDRNIGVKSVYAPSFLAVIERCAIIIALVTDIQTRFPAVSTRQWSFWFHMFNSALCLGTVVMRDPGNAMATFVLAQIDIAISMFNSVIQYGANTPRYHGNLQWLLKLRSRASSKISAASTAKKADSNQNADADQRTGSEDEEDVELIGWRTRLIERAGQNRQKSRTIRLPATPTGSHTTNVSNVQPNESEQMMANTSLPPVTFDSTDDMLYDIWDPMFLQDIFGTPHNQEHPLTNSGPLGSGDAVASPSPTQRRN